MYQPTTLTDLSHRLSAQGISLLGYERADGKGRLITRRTGDVKDPLITEVNDADDEAAMLDKVLTSHGVNLRTGENPEVGRVTGYRKLSDAELSLVNRIKEAGEQLQGLIQEASDIANADPDRINDRLTAINHARTNLQQGAMWLIRGVAAPRGFF